MHHHLPGGRVDEEDEDDDDPHVAAAQRETREETGVALEPGRFEAATDDDGEPLVLGGRAYFFVRLTDDDVHTESLLRRSRRRLAEKTPGFKVRRDYRPRPVRASKMFRGDAAAPVSRGDATAPVSRGDAAALDAGQSHCDAATPSKTRDDGRHV